MTSETQRTGASAETQGVCWIRGPVVAIARATIREVWGEDVHRAVVDGLTPEERVALGGAHPPRTFYPIQPWDRFLRLAAAEVERRTGENEEQFFARLMQVAGIRILRTIYTSVLGVMRPTAVAKLIPSLLMRLYTRGNLELSVNEPGRCVLVFTDDGCAYRYNMQSHLAPSVVLILGENGARDIEAKITKNECVCGRLTIEATATYRTETIPPADRA